MATVSRIAGLVVDKPPPRRIAQAFAARRWPVIEAKA
jgi:hypothetical protein